MMRGMVRLYAGTLGRLHAQFAPPTGSGHSGERDTPIERIAIQQKLVDKKAMGDARRPSGNGSEVGHG